MLKTTLALVVSHFNPMRGEMMPPAIMLFATKTESAVVNPKSVTNIPMDDVPMTTSLSLKLPGRQQHGSLDFLR